MTFLQKAYARLSRVLAKEKSLYLGFKTPQGTEPVLPSIWEIPPQWRGEPSRAISRAFGKATANKVSKPEEFPALTVAKLTFIPPGAFEELDPGVYAERKGYWRTDQKSYPVQIYIEEDLEQLATHYQDPEHQEKFRNRLARDIRLLRKPQSITDEIIADPYLLRATSTVMKELTCINPTKLRILTHWFAKADIPEQERDRCFTFLHKYDILNITGFDGTEYSYRHKVDDRPYLPDLSPFLELLRFNRSFEEVQRVVDYRLRKLREKTRRDLRN